MSASTACREFVLVRAVGGNADQARVGFTAVLAIYRDLSDRDGEALCRDAIQELDDEKNA